ISVANWPPSAASTPPSWPMPATGTVASCSAGPDPRSDAERADQALQLSHQFGQLAAGLGSVPGAFRSALPRLVDGHDVAVDVVGDCGLFLGGGGDLLTLAD